MSNSLQYWLTTHNPHVGSAKADWSLYLRPKHRSPKLEPHKGDKVLIYEQISGLVDGKGVRVGRGGVVAVAEVESGWNPRETTTQFSLEAKCVNYDFEGFVSFRDIGIAIVGPLKQTGLVQISEPQYHSFYRQFKSNQRRQPRA